MDAALRHTAYCAYSPQMHAFFCADMRATGAMPCDISGGHTFHHSALKIGDIAANTSGLADWDATRMMQASNLLDDAGLEEMKEAEESGYDSDLKSFSCRGLELVRLGAAST